MVDLFEVLSAHADVRLVKDPVDPWMYTGKWRCDCGEVLDSKDVPLGAYPSTTRYVLRRHQADVLERVLLMPDEVLLRESDWLFESVGNAEKHRLGYSPEYLKGARAAAGWVKFHSRVPERYPHMRKEQNRVAEDEPHHEEVGDQGAVEGPGV